jgi:uncharacterized protein YdhG (YjbR/CyaY superfamily)
MKKHQGHYCRICGQYKANEKFSGKGHAAHICKACSSERKAEAKATRKERLAVKATIKATLHPTTEEVVFVKNFIAAVAAQDADALASFFEKSAAVYWHNTNEAFTVEEYVRANCEYPGEWSGEVEHIEKTETVLVVVSRVWAASESFRVVSFINIVNGNIWRLDEYWGDVGEPPKWRRELNIGKSITATADKGEGKTMEINNSIDEYIAAQDAEVQDILRKVTQTIREAAPQTTERICMRMPTFDLNGKWLVHFGAAKNHLGFYPQPDGVAAFADRLTDYKTSKGAIQFPYNKPIPYDLIAEITRWKVAAASVGNNI